MYILNKHCSFKMLCLLKNPEKFIMGPKSSTLFPTLNINQNIRVISEGSYDTEDWSNDAENPALFHRNKLYFRI